MSRVWRPPVPVLPGQVDVELRVRGERSIGGERLEVRITSALPASGDALDQLVIAISIALRQRFYPVMEKASEVPDEDDE